MDPPQNPAGEFVEAVQHDERSRAELTRILETAPEDLRKLVGHLANNQLEVRYRNWSIRQIVHHLADSHVNSYIRFKWTLTEDQPTIKAYDEGRWAALPDSLTGDIRAPLALLEGVQLRWVQLLHSLTEQQFALSFMHPETGRVVTLNSALGYYAWHCKHHMAQIAWLCKRQGWVVE